MLGRVDNKRMSFVANSLMLCLLSYLLTDTSLDETCLRLFFFQPTKYVSVIIVVQSKCEVVAEFWYYAFPLYI